MRGPKGSPGGVEKSKLVVLTTRFSYYCTYIHCTSVFYQSTEGRATMRGAEHHCCHLRSRLPLIAVETWHTLTTHQTTAISSIMTWFHSNHDMMFHLGKIYHHLYRDGSSRSSAKYPVSAIKEMFGKVCA